MPLFGRQRPRSKRVFLSKVLPSGDGIGQPALGAKHVVPMAVIWLMLTAGTV